MYQYVHSIQPNLNISSEQQQCRNQHSRSDKLYGSTNAKLFTTVVELCQHRDIQLDRTIGLSETLKSQSLIQKSTSTFTGRFRFYSYKHKCVQRVRTAMILQAVNIYDERDFEHRNPVSRSFRLHRRSLRCVELRRWRIEFLFPVSSNSTGMYNRSNRRHDYESSFGWDNDNSYNKDKIFSKRTIKLTAMFRERMYEYRHLPPQLTTH